MDTAAWLITYVLLFSLLQLGVYYLYRRRSDREREGRLGMSVANDTPRDQASPPAPTNANPREVEGTTETSICPECGAKNASEPAFTYCRNCTGRLAG